MSELDQKGWEFINYFGINKLRRKEEVKKKKADNWNSTIRRRVLNG